MKIQSSRIVVAGVVLLLALMALLAGGAARRESVTIDEVAHIGAGVSARGRRTFPLAGTMYKVSDQCSHNAGGISHGADYFVPPCRVLSLCHSHPAHISRHASRINKCELAVNTEVDFGQFGRIHAP